MCGIIGYIGKQQAAPILLAGLQRLEYRGYDSAGIATDDSNAHATLLDNQPIANTLTVIKSVGKIAELKKRVDKKAPSATMGIGHTRWATHGVPSEANAHPHVSGFDDATGNSTIAVVHNGIIENANQLRIKLHAAGYRFVSQTDTETIAHLIDYYLRENSADPQTAFAQAIGELQGTYGIVAIIAGNRRLFVARKGSPLIIGIGDEEMFVASDASALIANTRTVQYLADGDLATITQFGYSINSLNGTARPCETSQIDWSLEEAQKGGYAHFMLKEIYEQPAVVSNTVRGRLREGKVKLSVKLPTALNKIHIVACGTSYNAGLIGKYYIEKHTRIPVEVHTASEFRYADPILRPDDLVIAISQSGETADTLAAVIEAKRRNVLTLGIVNVVGSTIAREVDSGIYTHAGIEVGVASTKAFTCQVTSLLLLTLALMQHTGKKIPAQLEEALLQLPKYIADALKQTDTAQAADLLAMATSAVYVGRNLAYPVALEGALKLKEISYIHAEGFGAGEMKHGPIALIDANTPSICLVQHNHVTEKMLSNMQEIKARGGKIIAVSEVDNEEVRTLSDVLIWVPHISPELSPILMSIPLQLLAYNAAVARNIDVDKPRNLAKSVTVE